MTIHCIRSIFTPIVVRKSPSLLYINKDFYDFRIHKTITNKVKTVEYSNIVEIRPVNLTNLYTSVLDITHLDYMFMYLDKPVKLSNGLRVRKRQRYLFSCKKNAAFNGSNGQI